MLLPSASLPLSAQMLVVTELEDPFLPLPDDLLVNLRDSRPVIEALLDSLPGGYSSATSADSAMGAALQAAFLVMGHVGGKLLLFQAAQPTLGAGRLKPSRENLNLYGTDREASLRNPEDQFFKRFAGEASSRQITLDVFIGTNGYADLASLSSIPRYTCGQARMRACSSSLPGTALHCGRWRCPRVLYVLPHAMRTALHLDIHLPTCAAAD